jgi:hypothetical protein
MATTVKLKSGLSSTAEQWLMKNIGRRLHYLHNSVGGEGWICKLRNEQEIIEGIDGNPTAHHYRAWHLTFEDDKMATWFCLMFPQ